MCIRLPVDPVDRCPGCCNWSEAHLYVRPHDLAKYLALAQLCATDCQQVDW